MYAPVSPLILSPPLPPTIPTDSRLLPALGREAGERKRSLPRLPAAPLSSLLRQRAHPSLCGRLGDAGGISCPHRLLPTSCQPTRLAPTPLSPGSVPSPLPLRSLCVCVYVCVCVLCPRNHGGGRERLSPLRSGPWGTPPPSTAAQGCASPWSLLHVLGKLACLLAPVFESLSPGPCSPPPTQLTAARTFHSCPLHS